MGREERDSSLEPASILSLHPDLAQEEAWVSSVQIFKPLSFSNSMDLHVLVHHSLGVPGKVCENGLCKRHFEKCFCSSAGCPLSVQTTGPLRVCGEQRRPSLCHLGLRQHPEWP